MQGLENQEEEQRMASHLALEPRWVCPEDFPASPQSTLPGAPTTTLASPQGAPPPPPPPQYISATFVFFSRQKREELAQKVAEERARREEESRRLEAEQAREREEQLRRQAEERERREREDQERAQKQVGAPGRGGEEVPARAPCARRMRGAAALLAGCTGPLLISRRKKKLAFVRKRRRLGRSGRSTSREKSRSAWKEKRWREPRTEARDAVPILPQPWRPRTRRGAHCSQKASACCPFQIHQTSSQDASSPPKKSVFIVRPSPKTLSSTWWGLRQFSLTWIMPVKMKQWLLHLPKVTDVFEWPIYLVKVPG